MKAMLQPGLLYVNDRGYASFELMRSVLDAGSSLITRVKDDLALHVEKELPVAPQAAQAGVVRDVILKRLGTSHHKDVVGRVTRLVIGKRLCRSDRQDERVFAATLTV